MTRLSWGEPGTRIYETGIDRGVFYPREGKGVPWNGLLAVSEAPSGSELLELYYDGEKALAQRSGGSFSARMTAYSYPQEFEEYDGVLLGNSQQPRKTFGLSYRTRIYDDSGNEYYLIHLVYNVLASASSKAYSSINASVEGTPFDWELQTIPEFLPTGEFSAHVIVDPRIAYSWAVTAFEDIVYGSESTASRMPSMLEVVALFENASIFKVTDNGDHTFTIDGPADAVKSLGDNLWELNWPSVVQIDTHTYNISSL